MTKNELPPQLMDVAEEFSRYIIYQRRLSEKTREVYYSEALSYLSFIAKAGSFGEDTLLLDLFTANEAGKPSDKRIAALS